MDTIPLDILERIKFSKLKRDLEEPFPTPIGLKPHTAPCEDCGEIVTDRKVELKVHQHPKPHWRSRCKACRLTKNPDTGCYDMCDSAASVFFNRRCKQSDK